MESLSETLKRVAEHRSRFSKPRRILLEQCCATLHGSAEVLELGAGDGQLFEDLPAALRDRFIALEPDPGCVKSLSRTYREVLQGRAEAIPAGDKRFSGAFGCCFLDVLDDPVAALEEMRRVLEPGAPFVHVLDMSTDLHGFFEALVDDGSSVAIPNVFTEVLETEWPHDIFVLPRDELIEIRNWLAGEPEGRVLEVFLDASRSPHLALSVYEQVNRSEAERLQLLRCFRKAKDRAPSAESAQSLSGRTVSSAFLFHARAAEAARQAGWCIESMELVRVRDALPGERALASIVGYVRSGRVADGQPAFVELGAHVMTLRTPNSER